MNFSELLKSLDYTDEQISKIVDEMKIKKLYISTEENLLKRYNKLKGQKEKLDNQLKAAYKTIADLKKNNDDNEILQQIIKQHENTKKILKQILEI